MFDELEYFIKTHNVDIFRDSPYYIQECDIDFIIERALIALKKDPSRLKEIVDSISENCLEDYMEIYNAFDKRRNEFHDCLCDDNFLLSEDSDSALKFLPHLYFYSLKNNYEYTINYKCYAYLPQPEWFNDMIINDDEMVRNYYNILVKNNYSIADDVEHPLFVGPLAFLASLTNDRITTYARCGVWFYFFSSDVKKFIYEKGFVELYKEKANLLPQFIVENQFVLEKYLKDKKQVDLAIKILSREDYIYFNEKEVLKTFGVDKNSIDDYVLSLYKEGKTRNTLTFKEKILMTFYAKKILSKENVGEYKVEMFAYSTNTLGEKESRGQIIPSKVQVFVTRKDDSLKDVLFTIIHETMHAKQNIAIKNINFRLDSDIDIYGKDFVLGEIFKDRYYKTNYQYISYEQDANFKAEIKLSKILNQFDDLFEEYKVIGEAELLKNRDYLNKVKKDSQATFTMNRIFEGKKYNLDNLYFLITPLLQ